MPRVPIQEFNSWAERGGNRVGNALKQAKSGVCSLYRNHPGFISGTSVPVAGAGAFRRGLMDSLCGDEPGGLPATEQPYSGGQCLTDYRWNFSTSRNPRNPQPGDANGEGGFVTPGPLTDFRVEVLINTDVVGGQVIGQWQASFLNGLGVRQFGSAVGNYPGDYPQLVFVREDGQTDDCGDPPIAWRGTDRYAPDPGELEDDITTPGEGNDITFPIIYAPVNVDLNITLNLGGVKFNFDLGGLSFDFSEDENGDIVNNDSGDFPDLSDLEDTVDSIDRKTDENPNNSPPPNPDDYDSNDRTESDDKFEEDVPGIAYVKITLTQLPTAGKSQFGDGSPDVHYAGWFEWLAEGFAYPRQPIHFQNAIFKKEPGATGYAYTLVSGAKGFATVITEK